MEYKNSKGKMFYLHKKMVIIGRNKAEVPNYYFSTIKGEDVELPARYTVTEVRGGLPMKKKL